jgi:tetratricopeptide (TPR) repeat protein
LAPATAREIDDALVRLTKAGWLDPAGGRYRFARPALREAVYRTLHADERRREHAAAARALAPGPGQELTLGDAFQRVFHLRAAREFGQMMRVLRPLMRALNLGGQAQQVLTLARWGLEALDSLPRTPQLSRQRIAFLEAAADASDRLGHREAQRRWLDALSDLNLSPENDREEVVRVYLLHGRYAFGTGQYGLARGFLRQAVELSAALPTSALRSESLLRLAEVQTRVGEMNRGRKLATQALNCALSQRQRAVSLLHLALIDMLGNALERALGGTKQALRLVRSSPGRPMPGIMAAAHMLRGRIYRASGRPRRALASIQAALRLAQLAGERRTEAEATARMGGLLLDLDQPDEAQARLRESLLLAGEIEDRRGQALSGTWLGILLWEIDDAQALTTLQRARRLAEHIGLQRTQALCLAIEARIALLATHRLQAAQKDAEQAFALMSRFGAELPDQIVITGTLAMVLDSAGQATRARELVGELRKRLHKVNAEIGDALTKRRHRTATTRLLEAVLSSEGVIYPRVRLLP